MAGPWEKFASPSADDGPWKKFGGESPAKPTPPGQEGLISEPEARAAAASRDQTPKPSTPPSPYGRVMDEIIGAGETAWTLGTGAANALTGGKSPVYQPRSFEGRRNVDAIGQISDDLHIPAQPLTAELSAMKPRPDAGPIPRPPSKPPGPKELIPADLQSKGYKLTPSQAGSDSMVGKALQGIGGKAQTESKLSQVNEGVINEAAAKDLGLPKGTPITPETVKPILEKYGGLRKQIDGIKDTYEADDALRGSVNKIVGDKMTTWAHEKTDVPPEYGALLKTLNQGEYTPRYLQAKIRILREDASESMRKGDTQLGKSQKATATALEDFLGRKLAATGNKQLLSEFQDSRKMTAKVYDYLESTNELGDVNAQQMSRVGQDKPLSGGAKDISRLGGLYPKAAKPSSTTGGYQPHSAIDMGGAALSAASGKPSGVMEFLGARPAARSLLATDFGQRHFARPAGMPKPPGISAQAWATIKNDPVLVQQMVQQGLIPPPPGAQ